MLVFKMDTTTLFKHGQKHEIRITFPREKHKSKAVYRRGSTPPPAVPRRRTHPQQELPSAALKEVRFALAGGGEVRPEDPVTPSEAGETAAPGDTRRRTRPHKGDRRRHLDQVSQER